MRRWNGWGDDAIQATLPASATSFLSERVGTPAAPRDATLAQALAAVESQRPRLPAHPLVDTSPEARLRASFGQSYGDWLRLRFGRLSTVVDGVAAPENAEQVRTLLDWAAGLGAVVVPCGGATSVVGHLAPPQGDRPVLSLGLRRMNRLLRLDPLAQLATFEAGASGPEIEAQLAPHGFTLGHFPQSFELSTLGGWVVTRSSGQQSARYGRIEALFAGGVLETPTGRLVLPTVPASAAGPDLRELVLGSEGRLGVLTEVTVRVTRRPERERFIAVFLPGWAAGEAAVRALAQARCGASMMRLANATETMTTLRLAGHERALGALERYLGWRGCGADKVLLMLGFTGSTAQVASAQRQAAAVLRAHGGVSTGELLGRKWAANRFRGVYLRNALWDLGFGVETMETAVDWPRVPAMMAAMEAAGRGVLEAAGERCHAYTHLSHVYPQGSSVYSTFVMRVPADFDTAWSRWTTMKRAVSDAILANGGTISHQHGVGKDHREHLRAEKGERATALLRALVDEVDPHGVMDSGNLLGPAGA